MNLARRCSLLRRKHTNEASGCLLLLIHGPTASSPYIASTTSPSFFRNIKHYRGIATHCEKRARISNFLAAVALVARITFCSTLLNERVALVLTRRNVT